MTGYVCVVLAGLGYDRRGSSYKVGLTAAGGSHVNAHSLTPTLASVPACTGKYSTYTWHCSSFTGNTYTGKCSHTYTAWVLLDHLTLLQCPVQQ